MDNLTVHRERTVKLLYSDLDIMPIWNVSYSPEFNPIESVFSQVKRLFSRERLNVIANHGDFDDNKTIRSAFAKVTVTMVTNCWAKSLYMLNDF